MADVESAIDRLYQLPLERFTAERNALAAELRKAGDRAAADRVKALGKPSVTAWAVNQAWWRNRDVFDALLDAGDALRAAHQAKAAGKAADVRAASDARQQALEAVVEAAVEALGGRDRVGADTRHRLAGTLDALASRDAASAAGVGRLTSDLHSTGLDLLGALAGSVRRSSEPPPPRPTIVSRRPAKPAADREAESRAARAAAVAAAREQLAARKAALRQAEADAAAAQKTEKKARAALEHAADVVADLERRLDAARDEEREARRAHSQAVKAASEADMVRARTARDVAEVERRLGSIE